MLGMAREGVIALEWETESNAFTKQFMSLFNTLNLHCLSERATLEKLSFLAALQSQHLTVQQKEQEEMAKIRSGIVNLNSMLIRYRTSMASDDCGGSLAARKFFKVIRFVQSIAKFKDTLLEQLQDSEYIMECSLTEERKSKMAKERLWIIQKDEFMNEEKRLRDSPKVAFDMFALALVAVFAPLLVLTALW